MQQQQPPQPQFRGYCGLKNIGSSCFLNSVLQCLFHTPVMIRHFLGKTYEFVDENNNLLKQFVDLFLLNWRSEYDTRIVPLKFVRTFRRKFRRFVGPQDAHEFLAVLLDQFHQCLKIPVEILKSVRRYMMDPIVEREAFDNWKRRYEPDYSLVTEWFNGQLCSIVECPVCHTQSRTYDPFGYVSLSLPAVPEQQTDNGQPQIDLRTLLQKFTGVESIDDWRCSKCKATRTGQRRMRFCYVPKVLVVHLKRFRIERGNRYYKNPVRVHVPEQLDLAPFLASAFHPSRSSKYQLYSYIVHAGSFRSGHYVAQTRATTNDWIGIDDDTLKHGRYRSDQAYMLFYTKQPVRRG